MRITVLDGHPRAASLGAALANAYAKGAESAGHEVRRLAPRDLEFAVVSRGYKEGDPIEPDLVAAQETIAWCEHLVVVHPVWWGGMPAELKGFFDRTFLPGWAFKFHPGKTWWDRLLAGRSAPRNPNRRHAERLHAAGLLELCRGRIEGQHARLLRVQTGEAHAVRRRWLSVRRRESEALAGKV